jgi:hypothetical protein
LPFASLESIAPPPRQPASLVLLMDVLEHIDDDRGFLTALRAKPYIGPDTKFLITVPAYQSLFCSHDAFLGHHRRYSNQLLHRLVDSSGLRVLDIGYFFSTLLPVRMLQVFKERTLSSTATNRSSGVASWTRGGATAAILRGALVLDWRLSRVLHALGIRLAGLSNYAICATSA